MKISTKGTYSIILLMDLAENKDLGLISLMDVSNRKNISKKYLEQIVPNLTKANLIHSIRGAKGGYQLARPATSITMWDILSITENAFNSYEYEEGSSFEETVSLFIFDGLDKKIKSYLESISLQDVIEEHMNKSSNNYII